MFLLSTQVFAQSDTLYIPGAQSLEISNIVNADTLAPEGRVYVLDRGAIYYIELALDITSPRKFIAKGDENERPPVLAPAIRADGSSEEWFFKITNSGVTLEINDLYLASIKPNGERLGWSRGITFLASDGSLILNRVVFDAFTEAALRADAANISLDVQNCHFRNLTHTTSWFAGQGFLSNQANRGKVIFKNNTFFGVGSYLFSVRGHGPDAVFEHNTVAYGIINPMLIRQADDIYIRNNLFYAAHAYGGIPDHTINGWFYQWPDSISSGIYRIRQKGTAFGGLYEITGPEAYDDSSAGLIFDPSTWTNVAENNNCYYPQALVDFYTTWNDTVTRVDSVEVPSGPTVPLKRVLTMSRWINDHSLSVLADVTDPASANYSPNVSVANNMGLDPQFTDQGVLDHVNLTIDYVHGLANENMITEWLYEVNFPPKWPIPENFSYSNEILKTAGTDGLPLGDLNWFPEVMGLEKIETSSGLPTKFAITKNYPNPFNPSTTIEFTIGKAAHTKLAIYNIVGQKVKTLYDQEFKRGTYKATWNGLNDYGQAVASGMYFITLESDGFIASKKVILIK